MSPLPHGVTCFPLLQGESEGPEEGKTETEVELRLEERREIFGSTMWLGASSRRKDRLTS